jgi:hypothetical protein
VDLRPLRVRQVRTIAPQDSDRVLGSLPPSVIALTYFAPKETEALRSMADHAATSRVWAGVQHPSDTVAGLGLRR